MFRVVPGEKDKADPPTSSKDDKRGRKDDERGWKDDEREVPAARQEVQLPLDFRVQ